MLPEAMSRSDWSRWWLWVSMVWAQRCKNRTIQSIRRCAKERGWEWYRREDAARLHCTRIGEVWLLPCGGPARDLRGLAASLRRGKGRDDREIRGSYSIGFDGHLVRGDGAGVNVGVTRAERKGEGIAGKKTLTGGSRWQGERRER
jgi:hypothetical protein